MSPRGDQMSSLALLASSIISSIFFRSTSRLSSRILCTILATCIERLILMSSIFVAVTLLDDMLSLAAALVVRLDVLFLYLGQLCLWERRQHFPCSGKRLVE